MGIESDRREREKNERKNGIIEAAEALFLKHGFDGVSVEEIGKLAQFTKRTVYRYFVNKEDLFYAVVLRRARELEAEYRKIYDSDAPALDRIRGLNRVFAAYYIDRPDLYTMMNYRPSDVPSRDMSPNYGEFAALKAMATRNVERLIGQGKKDGSIAIDLDVRMASHFGLLASMGLMQGISNMDPGYWSRSGLDRERFTAFSFGLLADSFAPHHRPEP